MDPKKKKIDKRLDTIRFDSIKKANEISFIQCFGIFQHLDDNKKKNYLIESRFR